MNEILIGLRGTVKPVHQPEWFVPTFEASRECKGIVSGWRFDLRPKKSLGLGLTADHGFEDNIRYYLEDNKPCV